MISNQFNMKQVDRKKSVPFRWEHKWLDGHNQWMWVKVYQPETSGVRTNKARSTAKNSRAGKTSILRGDR